MKSYKNIWKSSNGCRPRYFGKALCASWEALGSSSAGFEPSWPALGVSRGPLGLPFLFRRPRRKSTCLPAISLLNAHAHAQIELGRLGSVLGPLLAALSWASLVLFLCCSCCFLLLFVAFGCFCCFLLLFVACCCFWLLFVAFPLVLLCFHDEVQKAMENKRF